MAQRPHWEKPDKANYPVFITPRDVKVMLALQYHGQLRASYVSALAGFPQTMKDGRVELHTWYQRHRALWANDFIDEMCYNQYRENIIFLGKAGVEYLKARNLYEHKFEKFRNGKKGEDRELGHKLAVADLVADFEINLPKHGLEFIPRHQLADMTKAQPFRMQSGDSFVEPDDIFAIRYPNGNMRGIIVEAETGHKDIKPSKKKRSTIDTLIWHRKFLNDKAFTQLGMPAALVLTISPDEVHMGKVMTELPKHVTGTTPFLFTHNHLFNRIDMYAEAPKPDGSTLRPCKRAGHDDFDLLKI